jgi:hypothetical protein
MRGESAGNSTEECGFHGGDGVALVVGGRCWAGHVIDFADLRCVRRSAMRTEGKGGQGGGCGAVAGARENLV